MSVEELQVQLDKVIATLCELSTTTLNAIELTASMRAELDEVKNTYVPDGSAVTRAANEICLVCDRTTIVTNYVRKYNNQFGYDSALDAKMTQLHKEIVRMKKR